MATVQFTEHLDAAIADLDVEIASLTDKVAAFTDIRVQTVALRALYGSPIEPAPIPEPDPTPEPVPLKPAATKLRSEAEKARDRDRQARSRAGIKAPPGSKGTSKYDYAEVARIADGAVKAGHSALGAIMDHYNVRDAMGRWLIKEARKRGHEIERLGANKPILTVTPIRPHAPSIGSHPASQGFTPTDTLKLLEGGTGA